MMARMKISLPPEQQQRARARAAELGISFAEYVRRLVASDLGDTPTGGGIGAIFNLGDSGGSSIAKHKDEYVSQAVEAENVR
jgi:hypothetical protein